MAGATQRKAAPAANAGNPRSSKAPSASVPQSPPAAPARSRWLQNGVVWRFALGALFLAYSLSQSFFATVPPVDIDSTKIWTTLLSNRAYLPGLLVLDDSIKRQRSRYQLVVMITEEVERDADFMEVFEKANIPTRRVDPVLINGVRPKGTWEKLLPWNFTEYERVGMLDSDQLAIQNFDELMTMDLASDRIAAAHACTCNPRKLAHYPKDWHPTTCGFTTRDKKTGKPAPITEESTRTQHLLNSGTVVLRPSRAEYEQLLRALATEPSVPDMVFYDQDLLALTHRLRWDPLPYVYNGLKTLRECHADLWKDEDVKIVHYILQKPWKSRTVESDLAGATHRWWWAAYEDMEKRWLASNDTRKVQLFKEVVQPQLGN